MPLLGPTPRLVLVTATCGLAFTSLEHLAAGPLGHPLDPAPDLGATVVLGLLLGCLLVLVALPLSRRLSPTRSTVAALAAWALVWGPQGARAMGLPALFGWTPAPLILGTGLLSPPLGLALGLTGALVTPLGRRLAHPEAWTPARGDPAAAGLDVLLITVDTVRWDAGLLDRASGLHHSQAIAPAPWTLPSMISVMTGLPVAEHRGGLPAPGGYTSADPALPVLAEAFAEAGYATQAVVSNPHLHASAGFDRGFQRFAHSDDSREPWALAEALAERWHQLTGHLPRTRRTRDTHIEALATELLAEPAPGPRFTWVHLLGPHEYARSPDLPVPGWAPGTRDEEVLREAYRGNVEVAAGRVGRLMGQLPSGVSAVTSDHGEAMGEGGHWGHGKALQDAELRVPLLLRAPDLDPGVPDDQVSLVDLGTWLLQAGAGESRVGLPPHQQVMVAGLRADARAAAVRRKGAAEWTLLSLAELAGEAVPIDPSLQDRLRELGYTE